MPETISSRKWLWHTIIGAIISPIIGVVVLPAIDTLLANDPFRSVALWVLSIPTSAWRFLLSDLSVPMWLAMAVSAVALVATSLIILAVMAERHRPWRA